MLSAGSLLAVMGLALAQDRISPPPGYVPLPPPPPTGIVPAPMAEDGTKSLGEIPADPSEDSDFSRVRPLRGSTANESPMDIGITPPPGETEELPDSGAPDGGDGDLTGIDLDEPGLDPLAGADGEALSQDEPLPRDAFRQGGTVAVLRGLDKITARVKVVNAPIGKPVTFGKLKILADYCHKRPPEEPPEVTAFVQIDDARETDPEKAKVFSGWMFASSPALHAVEHPVYDVWLIDCKASTPESEFGTLPKEPTPKTLDSKQVR